MNATTLHATPRALGHAAFTSGRPAVPAQDSALSALLAARAATAARFNQPAPDSLPALLEWRAGYQSAQGWASLAAQQARTAVLTTA